MSMLIKDYPVRICVCGKTGKIVKADKNLYRNRLYAQYLGVIVIPLAVVFYPVAYATGFYRPPLSTIFMLTIFAFALLIYGYRASVYLKQGHKFVCAVRRTLVDVALYRS